MRNMIKITCFLWFESLQVLEATENIRSPTKLPYSQIEGQCSSILNIPIKWVASILSTTTQISINGVLRALMHVYHQRSITPNVTGSLGSEYGLVSIALVLASKCKYCLLSSCHQMEGFYFQLITTGVLDDCTDPNKTCTNMSYGLFPSANGWDEWLKNLVRYWEYYGKVLRLL
jgi:hypothetical protein